MQTSQLWGRNGEAWSRDSRLPDFSFAGYRRGEEPYRIPAESISVKSFGAKGDGHTDDTNAFRQAIAAGKGKVIKLPAGRCVERHARNRCFQPGAAGGLGRDSARVHEAARNDTPQADKHRWRQAYQWLVLGGGLITIGGGESSVRGPEVVVAGAAKRGDMTLQLDSSTFKVGTRSFSHFTMTKTNRW